MKYEETPQDFEIPIANGYVPNYKDEWKAYIANIANKKSNTEVTPPKEAKVASKGESLTPENAEDENEKKIISTDEPTHMHKNGCCVGKCYII